MDRFEKAFYHLKFREAFLEKKGTEFQNWFVKLASNAFGADFEAVRSYGNRGDFKCDGRRISTGTIFQCYAPDRMGQARLHAKINEDFYGALMHWGSTMAEWILVHNDSRGLPPQTEQLLDELRKKHAEISVQVWLEAQLQRLANGLSLTELQALFGYAPSTAGFESMVLEDIKPIIDELERMDPEPGQEPLTPPSVDKLVKNALSDDAATLLLAGRRKESLVDTWFRKNPKPELGERIAEAFRQRYAHLSETERSPDQIFAKLQQYAGMGGSPRRQAAALAVLSYFFARCDIFEDPEITP